MITNTNTKGFICKTCGRQGATNNGTPACAFHKCLINPETDFCSWHIDKAVQDVCTLCHQPFNINDLVIYITDKEEKTFVCQDCLKYMGLCHTCIHKDRCAIERDGSAPPYVMRTIQQGMMTMQTQIRNPKLVVKHCQKCVCSDGADPSIRDVVCFRDEHGTLCSHWQILPELLQ